MSQPTPKAVWTRDVEPLRQFEFDIREALSEQLRADGVTPQDVALAFGGSRAVPAWLEGVAAQYVQPDGAFFTSAEIERCLTDDLPPGVEWAFTLPEELGGRTIYGPSVPEEPRCESSPT